MDQAGCIEFPYPGSGFTEPIRELVAWVCGEHTEYAEQQSVRDLSEKVQATGAHTSTPGSFNMSDLSMSGASRAESRARAIFTG